MRQSGWDRRRFLRAVGTAATAALAGQGHAWGRQRAAFGGWAWVHGDAAGTAGEWRDRFARLRQAGVTGVLVSGGPTPLLSDAARAAGLAFHRWMWILNRPGDEWAKTNHPEWFAVSRNGDSSLEKPPYVGYYQWVCPTRAPVREYLRGLVAEVARDPLVDGVHLDYIRLPDVILPVGLWAKYGLVQDRELAPFDFCYCAVCRAEFRSRHGLDPLALPDPPQDQAWRRFRWDAVTGVVRVLAGEIRQQKKVVSAAVFPTPALARRLVRQAWDTWPLDAVFPMLYHRFYEEPVAWIGMAAREGVAALDGRFPLHTGLYLPDLTPPELAAAVQATRGAGAAGFSLFEMGGLTDAHHAALRAALGL